MFGIGPGELLLVAGLALVVVGPRKLPGFMKDAAQVMGQVKKAGQRLKQAVDPQDELGTVGREVRSAMDAAQGEFVDRPAGLDDMQMVCTPEEEWAAAIAAADAQEPADEQAPAGEPAAPARTASLPAA
ncbi:MAG: hypothetical protein V1797_07740 [Pseudomonadota bacterium]